MYLRIFVRGELRVAAGYVRYGDFAYNEDSAILVSGPKPKTLKWCPRPTLTSDP